MYWTPKQVRTCRDVSVARRATWARLACLGLERHRATILHRPHARIHVVKVRARVSTRGGESRVSRRQGEATASCIHMGGKRRA
eukprot:761077-Hanusia_phi.AAC.2